MKKNTLLLALVVLFLVIIYFYYEVGGVKRNQEVSLKKQLIHLNINQVLQWQVGPYLLKKEQKKNWRLSAYDLPVNQEYLQKSLALLKDIHIVEKISDTVIKKNTKSFFFANDAPQIRVKSRSNNKVTLTLGNFIPTTGRFYIEKEENENKTIYVCNSVYEKEGFFRSELDFEASKYNDLYLLFRSPLNIILEENFLTVLGLSSNISEVLWKKNENIIFSFLYDQNRTTPPVLQGLDYSKEKMSKFKKDLQNIKATALLPEEIELPSAKHRIKIRYSAQENLLSLYKKKDQYFLAMDEKPPYFLLKEGSYDLFFYNVQKFWDKKVQLHHRVEHFFDKEIVFSSEDKGRYVVRFMDDENVSMIVEQGEKNILKQRDNIIQFLSYFMGEGEKYEADYVEELTRRQAFVAEWKQVFSIKIVKTLLDIYQWKQEILIVDNNKRLVYHFSPRRFGPWWQELVVFFRQK